MLKALSIEHVKTTLTTLLRAHTVQLALLVPQTGSSIRGYVFFFVLTSDRFVNLFDFASLGLITAVFIIIARPEGLSRLCSLRRSVAECNSSHLHLTLCAFAGQRKFQL